jgi:citrate lyase beta subunit
VPERALDDRRTSAILDRLGEANRSFAGAFPGEPSARQPLHVVYGGAHLFKADTAPRLGQMALAALRTYAPDPPSLAAALDLPLAIAPTVYQRVVEKLEREPVEDFRIDFEDGYGNRPDPEEDAAAVASAREVAQALRRGTLPPFVGIRIKPLTEELKARAVRTLDLFVGTLVAQTRGKLPPGFIITLPKVQHPDQVGALSDILDLLEPPLGLVPGSLRVELMVETTQSIFDDAGRVAVALQVDAARGRCRGLHFGTYDYTAASEITAAFQAMDHPACDFAKQVMKVAAAGRGLQLSDGATHVMPVAPHRGPDLTPAQQAENREAVHRAWKLAYDHIRHSLVGGFYQGWDLHPAQLPIRYAAAFTFFLESFEQASARLKNFIDKAAQATLVGDVFDDAATGQGLLNYFLRALQAGAITLAEVSATGLTQAEVQGRSFLKILANRRRL